MDKGAEHLAEYAKLIISNILVLLVSDHGVDNDTEGQEEWVLGEKQNEKDTLDLMACKFVDEQIQNDNCLEYKQTLGFAPAILDPKVGTKSNNHVDGHHGSLEHDPASLYP